MSLVKCKTGGEMIEVPEGQDPHALLDATGCSHCADSHGLEIHCGESANNCPREHEGPCWQGPQSGERPDGCTVCRPVIFMGNANLILDSPAGAA